MILTIKFQYLASREDGFVIDDIEERFDSWTDFGTWAVKFENDPYISREIISVKTDT